MKKAIVIGLIFTAPLLSLTSSCISSDNDDEPQHPSVTDSIPNQTDSTAVVVDSTFRASLSDLQCEWMGAYIGYDPMQKKESAIRRFVVFNDDCSYDSHVQGTNTVSEDSVIIYKEFEHEHGTYSFDAEKQQIVYHVEYDSLLNFFTDKLEYNAGKLMQGTIQKEYSEVILFSYKKEGKRDWIRIDDNLRPIGNHSARLIYIMKNQ